MKLIGFVLESLIEIFFLFLLELMGEHMAEIVSLGQINMANVAGNGL